MAGALPQPSLLYEVAPAEAVVPLSDCSRGPRAPMPARDGRREEEGYGEVPPPPPLTLLTFAFVLW